MTISNAAELVEVFTMAWDTYSGIDPITVSQETDERINSRFARELLGVLTTEKFLYEDETPDGLMYSISDEALGLAHHEDNREEAIDAVKAWAGIDTKPAKTSTGGTKMTPRVEAPKEMHDCYCGCGAQVGPKSFYKPGHDARHAGVIGRTAAELSLSGQGHWDSKEFYGDLPSEKLVAKAKGIAEKAYLKATKKDEPADRKDPEVETGTVTVGKHQYPAQRFATGEVTYEKDGKSHQASKTAAKTFTVK